MDQRDIVSIAERTDQVRRDLAGWYANFCQLEAGRELKLISRLRNSMDVANHIEAGIATQRLQAYEGMIARARTGTFWMNRHALSNAEYMSNPKIKKLRQQARESGLLFYDSNKTKRADTL